MSRQDGEVFAAVLLSVSLFSMVLWSPIPADITVALNSIEPLTALALLIFLAAVFRVRSFPGLCLAFAAILVLFAQCLAFKWQTAVSDANLLAGLLPLNDARGYFNEAHRLMAGSDLSSEGSRRPLFVALLAALLSLTGDNLTSALAILAAVNGVAVAFATVEVRRISGSWSAALFTVLSDLRKACCFPILPTLSMVLLPGTWGGSRC